MGQARILVLTLLYLFSILTVQAQTTYNYKQNGKDWPGLCTSGQLQSPINISNIQGTCDNSMTIDMVLHNSDVQTSIVKDQAGLSSPGEFSVIYAKDINGLLIGYTGTQIQVHLPSEHQIDGSGFDLEIQFHHTIKPEFKQSLTDSGASFLEGAIVSILFNINAATSTSTTTTTTTTTAEFFNVWIPSTAGTFKINPAIAFNNTLDSTQEYYSYQGSRTQPDCTEDVNWYIFPQTQYITQLQFNEIKKYITGDLTFANGQGNNREIQSINGRVIKLGNITCEEQFIYFFSFFILYIFINYFIFKLL